MLTVFLAGLMVGRTPEYLGKKLESREMKLVLLGILVPAIVVLVGTGATCLMPFAIAQLSNHGPHGLSELLYAWASTANNNGSAFGGLNVNTTMFNIFFSLAMLAGRFGVMLPVLAMADSFASKKSVPTSNSTFETDTLTFAILLIAVILIVGALTFMPALSLGPVMEHFAMQRQLTY
jgi:K+-transporting ATPase ATPase A chain